MTRRIVVVGGGLAGMAAALTAAGEGAQVTLVERRPVLGGLTSSTRRHGLWFDNGQHVFLRCCTEYLGFLGEIGATAEVTIQRRLDVPVLEPGRARASIRRTGLPAPLHLARSLATYGQWSIAERLLGARAALALRRLDPEDMSLDEVGFGGWLREHGQSEHAIERLWDLIALPTLNVRADEASLQLAVRVFRTGLFDRADAGDIGWSTVPLARLHGENGARALEDKGVELVLGSPVEALDRLRTGELAVATGDRELVADAAVVATAPKTAVSLGVLDPAVAAGLGTSPIVNVHLVLDRRVTELPFAACVGSPMQFVFDRTASAGLSSGQCLAISLSAADEYLATPAPQLVATFTEALGEMFPSAQKANVVDAAVTRERAATFRARPGTGRLRPGPARTSPGVLLAGAYCATGWPATMEGAVRSGREAARAALSFLEERTLEVASA